MAKIKVNNLPEGFEIKNGKVVKKMAYGGHTTGDQSEYGLVGVPSARYDTFINKEHTPDVRYSVSAVPRDVANVEAEGGETVLADLNNDGSFGLYDIKGKRHSNGGVPLYMPPQSFFYSDTPTMKFKRNELADFGIKSKKGITPAKISKMPGFQINEYYGALDDEFVDPIMRNSAELMIDKNKMNLSKLAFAQEAKKKFEDGVPTASYPYLVSQGQDPIEFTQRIEEITRQEAEMKALSALPPDQLEQLMMLRDFLQQAQTQQQAQNPVNMAQRGPMAVPAAQYGGSPFEGLEMDIHDQYTAEDEAMLGNEDFGAMQTGGEEEMSDEEYSEQSGQGEQVVVGEYQTQNFDLCPRASELYEEIAEEGEDIGIAQESAVLHDQLFAIERNAIAQDYATEEDVANAKELARQIMVMAKDMGLLKAHNYIKDHIKKIEELAGNTEKKKYGGQKDLPKFQDAGQWNWQVDAQGRPVELDAEGKPLATQYAGNTTIISGNNTAVIDNPELDKTLEGNPAIREYQNLERLFRSNDPKWKTTVDRAYEVFKAKAQKDGFPIPSKEEMIDKFLNYQKNNYTIKAIATPAERQLKGYNEEAATLGFGDYDRYTGTKNDNTQKLFNTLKEKNKAYSGYNIDDTETKQNQAFFQALYLADANNAEPYMDVVYEGPNQDVNWIQNKEISNVEGYYGNNTLNQFIKVREPKEKKKPEPVQPKEGCPCIDPSGKYTGTYSKDCCPKPPDLNSKYIPPQYQFWAQDMLKANAIAQRERRMFMPWQPAVSTPQVDYVLEDPTREIAANMEAFNIASQASGAFGGPQALAARTAQGMGKTFAANANTLANVNSRNVSTINAGKALNAQLQERGLREQRDRRVKEYDDTQKVLQEFLNERNYDREKFADAYANMLTNAAYTYDLNTLNPYYNIMPATGGIIQMANSKGPFTPTPQGNQQAMYERMAEKALELKNKGLEGNTINVILKNMSGQAATSDEEEAVMEAMQKSLNFPFTPAKAKKGKEMKRYAVPFYTGKVGY